MSKSPNSDNQVIDGNWDLLNKNALNIYYCFGYYSSDSNSPKKYLLILNVQMGEESNE